MADETPRPMVPVRRRRRWLFRLMAFGLSLALLEGLSAIAWWMEIAGTSWRDARELQIDIATSTTPQSHPTEAIHPYVGWVLNPDLHPAQEAGGRRFAVNRFGFVDDGDTVYKRSPDRLLVGIVGGSVAQQVSLLSSSVLRERLESAPGLEGRTVQFVRLALSGHKQPQQLMSLAYLLALGGELDVLINVDGFNEVTLTMTENAMIGVALSYPRSWHHRLQDVVDPRIDSESFDLLRLKVARRRAARFMRDSTVGRSPTLSLAWLFYDRWIAMSLASLADTVAVHRKAQGHGFAKDGPDEHFRSDDERVGAVCNIWKDGSRQLHRLCEGNGICYVHVLQPNQYLEGSKPLSDLEKERCYSSEQRFAEAIRVIYPRLRQAGESLRAEGVSFHDGTQLFATEADTTYADYLCHYNQKGNDIVASAVAQHVVERLCEQPPAAGQTR